MTSVMVASGCLLGFAASDADGYGKGDELQEVEPWDLVPSRGVLGSHRGGRMDSSLRVVQTPTTGL